MRVKLDLEQSIWHGLLARCAEENVNPSDCINAWIRRAIRQERTVMPGADRDQVKPKQEDGDGDGDVIQIRTKGGGKR